jgi:antitoxin YefM
LTFCTEFCNIITMTKTLPITKAREQLTTLVEKADKLLNEYVITVNGLPAAALISASEYESWKETLDILSDRNLVKAIKEGERDLKKGKFVTFEQLKKELKLRV